MQNFIMSYHDLLSLKASFFHKAVACGTGAPVSSFPMRVSLLLRKAVCLDPGTLRAAIMTMGSRLGLCCRWELKDWQLHVGKVNVRSGTPVEAFLCLLA